MKRLQEIHDYATQSQTEGLGDTSCIERPKERSSQDDDGK